MPAPTTFLIEDGYTLRGTVEATALTPKIDFVFRPALPEAIDEMNLAPRQTGKQATAAVTKFLAAHIVSWSAVDGKGEPVPVSAEALRRVPKPALVRLVDVVGGYSPAQAGEDVPN